MSPLLAFEDIAGGYGDTLVVRGVGDQVAAGQVLVVTGRNGVGKSTLMKLLFGFLPLSRGLITFQGQALARLKPAERSRLGIAYCPQERIVFDDLTVWENLALMHPERKPEHLAAYFARFPRLHDRLAQRAGTLSGGERKLLSFTRALAEARPLALMDEPTEGVQHENVAHMADLVNQDKANGTGFLIVEQNLAFAEAVADAWLVLDQGRAVLQGTRAALGRDQIAGHLRV